MNRQEWPTRFLREVGMRAWLRVYWGTGCKHGGCHNAMIHLMDSEIIDDWSLGGIPAEYAAERWPTVCDDCKAVASPEATKQVHHRRLYRTGDGREASRSGLIEETFQPGDLWIVRWHEPNVLCHHGWTNCNGQHLCCRLPNGHDWDIDSRASNCTMRDDGLHRCWVRHGDPERGELVDVDKAGLTCKAGAGSIQAGNFHGFLHRGVLHT